MLSHYKLEQIFYEYHPLNLRCDVTALTFYYFILIVIVCLEVEPKMTNLVNHINLVRILTKIVVNQIY